MCIEEVTAFKVDGTYYEDERDAIEHKLKKIGQRLMKEYSAEPMQGLIDMRDDILTMLTRHQAFFPGEVKATEKAIPETERGPKANLKTLNEGHHITGCRARATGYLSDCDCKKDSKL